MATFTHCLKSQHSESWITKRTTTSTWSTFTSCGAHWMTKFKLVFIMQHWTPVSNEKVTWSYDAAPLNVEPRDTWIFCIGRHTLKHLIHNDSGSLKQKESAKKRGHSTGSVRFSIFDVSSLTSFEAGGRACGRHTVWWHENWAAGLDPDAFPGSRHQKKNGCSCIQPIH